MKNSLRILPLLVVTMIGSLQSSEPTPQSSWWNGAKEKVNTWREKHNPFVKAQKYWRDLSESAKEKARTSLQHEAERTFTPEYVWKAAVEPQIQEVEKHAAGIGALAAQGAVAELGKYAKTYGAAALAVGAIGGGAWWLYNRAVRAGLGGIVEDFKKYQLVYTKLVQDLDATIVTLKEKPALSAADKNSIQLLMELIDTHQQSNLMKNPASKAEQEETVEGKKELITKLESIKNRLALILEKHGNTTAHYRRKNSDTPPNKRRRLK
jgi:hypothetical protein